MRLELSMHIEAGMIEEKQGDAARREIAEAIIAEEYITCVVSYTLRNADGTYRMRYVFFGDPFAAAKVSEITSMELNDCLTTNPSEGNDE